MNREPVLRKIENAIPSRLYEALFRIQARILRIADFLRPAPAIEGVPRNEQTRNLCELIQLKLKNARGEELSFTERKKLSLSDASHFRNNRTLLRGGKFEIDEGIRDLVESINSKEYLFTRGSCSGHISQSQDGGQVLFNDTGFSSFEINEKDERSDRLLKDIEAFCGRESASDHDCLYKLEVSGSYPKIYNIIWQWQHPLYLHLEELQTAYINANNETERAKVVKEMDDLHQEKIEASKLAKEQNIHGKHMAFVERLKTFIANFA